MKKSKGQNLSESTKIALVVMQKMCLEIYDKAYVIKSLSIVSKLEGGNQTVLNCECKKHKICFKTIKSKFLNDNKKENRTTCSFCYEEKQKEKFNTNYYQKKVDRYKGENIALVTKVEGQRLMMECLKHGVKYSQLINSLNSCGCNECIAIRPRSNTRVTLLQINEEIKKWGDSLVALKIIGTQNKLKGSVRKILYVCKKTGHEGDIIKPLNTRLHRRPCLKCSKEAKSATYTQMVERATKIHPIGYTYAKTLEVYKWSDLIRFKCPTCSKDNSIRFEKHIYNKRGCFHCIRKNFYQKRIISDEQLMAELKTMGNDNFYFSGHKDYINGKLNRQVICRKHNEKFYMQGCRLALENLGCKICNVQSKMERVIMDYLKIKKIDFISQKKFKDCVYIKELPFDFYIPSVPFTNKSVLIEYDGEQHFNPIYGEEMFELQIKRDAIKTAYAKSIGIALIRIPYTMDKQIFQILDKILFGR